MATNDRGNHHSTPCGSTSCGIGDAWSWYRAAQGYVDAAHRYRDAMSATQLAQLEGLREAVSVQWPEKLPGGISAMVNKWASISADAERLAIAAQGQGQGQNQGQGQGQGQNQGGTIPPIEISPSLEIGRGASIETGALLPLLAFAGLAGLLLYKAKP